MCSISTRIVIASLVSLIAWGGGGAHGQTTTSQPAIVFSTIPYADYSVGFEMRLPAAWLYERSRYPGPDHAIGLLRGREVDGRRTLQVLVFRQAEKQSFPDWLSYFERQLAGIGGTQKIRHDPFALGQRTGAVVDVDAKAAARGTKTLYLCVPFDDRTTWVFQFAGDCPDEAAATQLRNQFDQLAASVRVLYDREVAEQIAAALDRGRLLVTRLRAHAEALVIDPSETHYEILAGGQPIGYLVRSIDRQTRELDSPKYGGNRKEGLWVREVTWRFPSDGSVFASRQEMFVSFDMKSELIETQVTRVPPEGRARKPFVTLDQCVREDELLFSSYSTNFDVDLPDPRDPLRLSPGYLSLAWVRLLPALLGTEPGEQCAVTIYDAETRALVTHSVKALGPRDIPELPGKHGYAFETREGFAGDASTVYTDGNGLVLRVELGDVVVRRASEKELEQRYAQQRATAVERARELASMR